MAQECNVNISMKEPDRIQQDQWTVTKSVTQGIGNYRLEQLFGLKFALWKVLLSDYTM